MLRGNAPSKRSTGGLPTGLQQPNGTSVPLPSGGSYVIVNEMQRIKQVLIIGLIAMVGFGCTPAPTTAPAPASPRTADDEYQTEEQIEQVRRDTAVLKAVLERSVASGKLEGEDRELVISFLRGPGPDQWAAGSGFITGYARISPQSAQDALELFKREVPKRAYDESPTLVPGTLRILERLAAAKPSSP